MALKMLCPVLAIGSPPSARVRSRGWGPAGAGDMEPASTPAHPKLRGESIAKKRQQEDREQQSERLGQITEATEAANILGKAECRRWETADNPSMRDHLNTWTARWGRKNVKKPKLQWMVSSKPRERDF